MTEIPRFIDKTVLITGGTSGIGASAARRFAAEGARVWFCGLIDDLGHAVVQQISETGGTATYVKADVRQASEMQGFVKRIVDSDGKLDIAFNNAGINHPADKVADIAPDIFNDVIQTNAMGVVYAMQAELPVMVNQGHGVIINTASILATEGAGWMSAYGMSKHAVLGLTLSAAMDYRAQGIRINAISPGPTDTPMYQSAMADIADSPEKYAGGLPENGPAHPRDIAHAVLYLASNEARMITGTNMVVDGGVQIMHS